MEKCAASDADCRCGELAIVDRPCTPRKETAFELLQRLHLRNDAIPHGSRRHLDLTLEQRLQNVATIRCSGAHWAYVSEGEMAEALEHELEELGT